MTALDIFLGIGLAAFLWWLIWMVIKAKINKQGEILDASLDRCNAMLDACFCYDADNGKNNLVNRHLRQKAQQFEREAAAAQRRKARWMKR